MTPKPPSPKQLSYLRALANRTGQTFTYPRTSVQASQEIARLRAARASDPIERAMEHFDLDAENAARAANCDVPISPGEIVGFGSSCTWSRRS